MRSAGMARPVVAAPMSYTGSAQRLARHMTAPTANMWEAGQHTAPGWRRAAMTALAVLAIAMAWTMALYVLAAWWLAITAWYAVTIIMFGWLLVPWRIIRRRQRRTDAYRAATLAALQERSRK